MVGSVIRFRGAIAGVGTTSGVRVVVGRWDESPYGPFADAMVATATGRRVLLAPSAEVAELVAATYTFDEVRVEPVEVTGWRLSSPSLSLEITVGDRTALGRALRLVPRRVAESPAWCTVTDPVARARAARGADPRHGRQRPPGVVRRHRRARRDDRPRQLRRAPTSAPWRGSSRPRRSGSPPRRRGPR